MLAAALYRRAGKDRNSQELRQGFRDSIFIKIYRTNGQKKRVYIVEPPQINL
jgi:hypothetical protein